MTCKILVSGAAGFIGMHTCKQLLTRGDEVLGIDNLNDYYDVTLKEARIAELTGFKKFSFHKLDIADRSAIDRVFVDFKPEIVIHLAAQAGVRYSLVNPQAYVESNLQGFVNILEGVRNHPVKHLVYASSSSVYGGSLKMPFSESDNVDHPVSLYAATKKSNELMAHTYSHLFNIPTTGLRFFTVYGPWGRPDMSPMLFTSAILAGKPINIFNHGRMRRDFTFIDDIVEGIVKIADRPATPDEAFDCMVPNPASSNAPYRIYNIGNSEPVDLPEYIKAIEDALGIKAKKNFMPMQPGDVTATYADMSALKNLTGFAPQTSLRDGVQMFVNWYRSFYEV